MRRRRTTVLGMALATAAALALSGCSSAGAGQESESGAGTVVLWYLPDDQTFIERIKPVFEKDNPGITLEAAAVPEDNYVTKVDTAILAQQPPDVVYEYDTKWIKSGRVVPVNDLMADAGVDTSVFNPVALNECTFDGVTYCQGSLGGAVMLIYNKDMLDAAGIPYPSTTEPMTIDEWATMARALAKPDDDPNKSVFGGNIASPLYGMASSANWFGADGKSAEGNLDSDRTIHLFDVMSQLAREGVAASPSASELRPDSDILASGNAAMAVTDFSTAIKAMDAAGLRWGAAPPPVIEAGDQPYMFVGTDKYSVLKGGTNTEGGKKFLVWLAENGGKYRIENGDPPLDATLLPDWAGDSEGKKEAIEVLSVAKQVSPFVPQYYSVVGPIGDAYTLLANGEETDAGATLKQITPEMQDKLDEAWASWNAIK